MAELGLQADERVLAGLSGNEDGAVVRFPPGKVMVQTLDFLTPIVNDPYRYGQIAAANALSDVYAMGGQPYTAMNIVCFPLRTLPREMLGEILRGGRDMVLQAGAVLVGGHSVEDEEIKYGLSVTGVADAGCYALNSALKPGDQLVLTKPLGTGVLAVGVKAKWEGSDHFEELLYRWGSRLNKAGGEAIRLLGLKAATDVTGFGLGGHLLEMARASGVLAELWLDRIPVLAEAVELASQGMVPQGCHANRRFCAPAVDGMEQADPVLLDLLFDPQTSGGLLLAVSPDKLDLLKRHLEDQGDLAAHIGQALPSQGPCGRLRLSGDGAVLT